MWVLARTSPSAPRCTITLRRRCRSMPTYCRWVPPGSPSVVSGLVVEPRVCFSHFGSRRREELRRAVVLALALAMKNAPGPRRPSRAQGLVWSRGSDTALLHRIKGLQNQTKLGDAGRKALPRPIAAPVPELSLVHYKQRPKRDRSEGVTTDHASVRHFRGPGAPVPVPELVASGWVSVPPGWSWRIGVRDRWH
jgi:hypothetical protein